MAADLRDDRLDRRDLDPIVDLLDRLVRRAQRGSAMRAGLGQDGKGLVRVRRQRPPNAGMRGLAPFVARSLGVIRLLPPRRRQTRILRRLARLA
jgi:hypothetical protein